MESPREKFERKFERNIAVTTKIIEEELKEIVLYIRKLILTESKKGNTDVLIDMKRSVEYSDNMQKLRIVFGPRFKFVWYESGYDENDQFIEKCFNRIRIFWTT